MLFSLIKFRDYFDLDVYDMNRTISEVVSMILTL